MKRVYQTRFGMPDGNCFAACVASIFELDEIPEISGTDETWLDDFNNYLAPHGLWYFEFHFSDESDYSFDQVPGYCIFTGPSQRGINHAVVGHKGKIVHDPYPNGNGIEIKNCGVFVLTDHSMINSKPFTTPPIGNYTTIFNEKMSNALALAELTQARMEEGPLGDGFFLHGEILPGNEICGTGRTPAEAYLNFYDVFLNRE